MKEDIVSIIEVLNDWGYRILLIDGIIYEIDDIFYPDSNLPYLEFSGRNITRVVKTTTSHTGFSEDRKKEFFSKISSLKTRRRKHNSQVKWTEFLATGAFNS